LIEQVPNQLWMIVPQECKTRISLYRIIRSKTPSNVGIEDHGHYRITSIERTLVEALKYANKIGLRTAIGAIRVAIKDGKTTEVKIGRMAEKLKMKSILVKYWETFVE
jgi:predicted transcriptional regulator of viral defense system